MFFFLKQGHFKYPHVLEGKQMKKENSFLRIGQIGLINSGTRIYANITKNTRDTWQLDRALNEFVHRTKIHCIV